ncbi:MAG TPA: hypothetical protein VN456_13290 [Desulfosporosinus sp.]|nr:hypothetical protein [Desulfosporosinus sp.]
MSIFTVVIIIGAIYQLYTAVTKKKGTQETPGKQQMPGQLPNSSLKPPDVRSIGDVMQGISRGKWKEQLKQALENGSYQARSLESTAPDVFERTMDYVETEGTQGMERAQGSEGTQGTEGTSGYVGILGAEAYKSTTETPGTEMGMNPPSLRDFQLSLTQRDLVQGVVWAEILGKPRAMHPYRGPRT